MNVAILGHGTIGGGVSRILLEREQRDLQLKAVSDPSAHLDAEFYTAHQELFREAKEVFADPEIDIVCETIGGDTIALQLVKQALTAGKHVVTANKKMIAKHFEELQQLAEENNVKLLFEAAVAGGIPVLSTIELGLGGDKIEEIEGILNGTTNFILTKMEETGASFDEVLKEAQELGYAEADPTDDIEGFDAVYKLCILIALAFGKRVDPETIKRQGISRLKACDSEYAERQGKKIKLVARALKKNDGIVAEVSPMLFPEHSRIAKTSGVLNAVNIRGKYNTSGNFFSGEGAGRFPTAAAIVSDMALIAQNTAPKIPKLTPMEVAVPEEQEFYIRFMVDDQPGIIGEVGTILGKYGASIHTVDQIDVKGGIIPFAITTNPVAREKIEAAMKDMENLEYNAEKPLLLPISS